MDETGGEKLDVVAVDTDGVAFHVLGFGYDRLLNTTQADLQAQDTVSCDMSWSHVASRYLSVRRHPDARFPTPWATT